MFQARVQPEKERLLTRSNRCLKVARATPEDTPRYRVLAMRSHEHAVHRLRALNMKRSDLLDICGTRTMVIECGCPGKMRCKVGCNQTMLCDWCSAERSKRWRDRISEGLTAAVEKARARWHATPSYRRRGQRPGVYMITFTIPHSGDFAIDRVVMNKGLRKLTKHGRKRGWWSAFVWVYEQTPGDDGRGNLHVHCAAVSSWIDYEDMHRVWRRAVPGALVLDVQAPGKGRTPETAARYLSKYITKRTAIEEFTGAKAGELAAAFRNKRRVTTSPHFWVPPLGYCEKCGVFYEMTESPCSLSEVWARTRPPAKSAIYLDHLERLAREAHDNKQMEMRW